MAKKADKLEEAVRKQAANLPDAQHNFVLAQFEHYQWNEGRIAELEDQLENGVVDAEGYHNYDAEGKLFRQRHQLVAEQGTLFSHIMRWLKGTEENDEEKSPLDEFL